MIQQPRGRKYKDRKIRAKWCVEPATGHHGDVPLVAVKLGNLETIFIPPRMATSLADALIDAVETGTTTTYRKERNGQETIPRHWVSETQQESDARGSA